MRKRERFASRIEALDAFASGKPVAVWDGREEKEADLIVAGYHLTGAIVGSMDRLCGSFTAMATVEEYRAGLGFQWLPSQESRADSNRRECNMCCPVDYLHPCQKKISTGASAHARSLTIQATALWRRYPRSFPVNAEHFRIGGHVIPLVAQDISIRQGHTEIAVALCRLTDLPPVAAITEIGSRFSDHMASLKEIFHRFGHRGWLHRSYRWLDNFPTIPIISIGQVLDWL